MESAKAQVHNPGHQQCAVSIDLQLFPPPVQQESDQHMCQESDQPHTTVRDVSFRCYCFRLLRGEVWKIRNNLINLSTCVFHQYNFVFKSTHLYCKLYFKILQKFHWVRYLQCQIIKHQST